MQAAVQRPHRAPDRARVHDERHRPEQTTLYRLVQQHAPTFIAQTEDAAGADLPQFVKDEFDAFPGLRWIGLDVRRHTPIDANHATVEFVARSKRGGRAERLHELSRFERVGGRWLYVEAIDAA